MVSDSFTALEGKQYHWQLIGNQIGDQPCLLKFCASKAWNKLLRFWTSTFVFENQDQIFVCDVMQKETVVILSALDAKWTRRAVFPGPELLCADITALLQCFACFYVASHILNPFCSSTESKLKQIILQNRTFCAMFSQWLTGKSCRSNSVSDTKIELILRPGCSGWSSSTTICKLRFSCILVT